MAALNPKTTRATPACPPAVSSVSPPPLPTASLLHQQRAAILARAARCTTPWLRKNLLAHAARLAAQRQLELTRASLAYWVRAAQQYQAAGDRGGLMFAIGWARTAHRDCKAVAARRQLGGAA